MKGPSIRAVRPDGIPALLAIYGPIVRDTVISFEYDIPTEADFAERVARITRTHPWLVCEIDGEVAGYAYGSPHRERKAYSWSADVSVYIGAAYRRQGIARALYRRLFDELRDQGIRSIFAGVTLPNKSSVALHRSFGFEDVGVYRNVGFKFGEWHDVQWMQAEVSSS